MRTSKATVVAASLMLLSTSAFTHIARSEPESQWVLTGSGTTYRLDGAGDATSPDGATVSLRSDTGDESKFGAAAEVIDAAEFRGHAAVLSAELSTRDAKAGAGIWLRADGPPGQTAFMNSMQTPVLGSAAAEHREVEISVPAGATRLVLGTLLSGNGQVTAAHLRLTKSESDPVGAGVSPQNVLDAAIEIVRANALRSPDVDWNFVEPELHAMIRDAKTSADVYPAIRALLAKLDDHHSFFVTAAGGKEIASRSHALAEPVVSADASGVGYVSIPGYIGPDEKAGRAFATSVIEAIDRISGNARCGWIVDLREDTGGNMWPMLAALKPFLGDGNLGSFARNFGRSAAWRAGDRVEAPAATGPDLSRARVAVLVGPRTASAGEAVAIAFRGRPHTRSFGAASAGLTSGNGTFQLPDGSMIMLASVVELDRYERAYTGKLEPDVPVAAAATGREDTAQNAARAWLKQECDK